MPKDYSGMLKRTIDGDWSDFGGEEIDGEELSSFIVDKSVARDPRGVRIENAHIRGALDLEDCTVDWPIMFRRCRFYAKRPAPALLDDSDRELGFPASLLHDEDATWRLTISGRTVINLKDARLYGISLKQCRIYGDVLASRMRSSTQLWVTNCAILGQIKFYRATVAGPADLRKNRILLLNPTAAKDNPDDTSPKRIPVALDMEGMRIDGDCELTHTKVLGPIMFRGLDVKGRLALDDVTLRMAGRTNPIKDVVVNGDGATITGRLFLARARIEGGMRWQYAQIGGPVLADVLNVDSLRHPVALDFTGAKITGSLICRWATILGEFALKRVEISERLALHGSCLTTIDDVALDATGSTINSVRLDREDDVAQLRDYWTRYHRRHGGKCNEEPSSFRSVGAIVFNRATIKGQLSCRHAVLRSADRGEVPAACCSSIAPKLISRNDPDGLYDIAFSAQEAHIGRLVMPHLKDDAAARAEFNGGIIDLNRCRAAVLEDHPSGWHRKERGKDRGSKCNHIRLDGFQYQQLVRPLAASGNGINQRINYWLKSQYRDGKSKWPRQPWVQLAEVLRAQGYLDESKQVLIELRRNSRRPEVGGPFSGFYRWVAWLLIPLQRRLEHGQDLFLDWVASYGYNPWKSFWWSVILVVAFACVWFNGAAHHCHDGENIECSVESLYVRTAVHQYSTERPGVASKTYPEFSALGYSLDLFIPFVDLGYQNTWQPNPNYDPDDGWREWRQFERTLPCDPRCPVLRYVACQQLDSDGRVFRARSFGFSITVGAIYYIISLIEIVIGFTMTSLTLAGFAGLIRARD